MAKFLFATWPSDGHVNPALPVAKMLLERGHEVQWYTSSHYQAKVEATGAKYLPFRHIHNFSGSTLKQDFPDMPTDLEGIKMFKWGIRNIIAFTTEGFDKDIAEIRKTYEPDVIFIDPTFTGIIPIKLRGDKIKTACYGILPLSVTSRDTAPFGLGVVPKDSAMGRLKNKLLTFFVQKVVFKQEQAHFNNILKRMGLPKLDHYFLDVAVYYSDLYMQGTCPSFEYKRSDLPSNVRFVGPFNAPTVAKQPLPEWWPELKSGKPVILVTQGTLANEDFNNLMIPTIQALANKDVLVVATTGNKPFPTDMSLPANVRVEKFIPYSELMPHVDVMVTNAGLGGVHYAIQQGVPLVVSGQTEDKPEVSARVEWSGIGINLRKDKPEQQEITAAIEEVLKNKSYKQKVNAMKQEFATYNAYDTTVKLLEELAARR